MNDALAVLDATGAGSAPAVVRASIGGQAALDLPLTHPERVSALVLIGSAVRGAPLTDHANLPQAERRLCEAIKAAEAATSAPSTGSKRDCAWTGPLRPRGG